MSASRIIVLAGAALALTACSGGGGGAGEKDAAKQAALASLPTPYNTADLANGAVQFGKCRACHTVVQDGANMVGPNLWGVFGRPAGTKADYKYSETLKNAGFVWEAKHLDDWIANPQTYMPGTKMSFAGVPEEKDRIDLIAYLKVETGFAPPK